MTRVGLVFGGRSVEHKVSVNSARTVARGLRDAGHEVVPLGIGPDGGWLAPDVARKALGGEIDHLPPHGGEVASSLRILVEAKIDVLFPIIHGTWGEDGTLQGLAEMLDLPYVGTGVTTSAVAMDKIFCKRLLAARGLPVVDDETIDRRAFERDPDAFLERAGHLGWPVFVKPSVGGSSVGVSRVDAADALGDAVAEALRFDDRVLVERAVAGREIECAVLGYGEIEASVLGEIVPGKEFYDYADKYIEDTAELLAPAPLGDDVADELRRIAVRAFEAIGGWGMARVDFLFEGPGRFFLNEINTLPGFTDISMYPRLWDLTGVPLPALVDRLVTIAQRRHADRRALDAGIKSFIASLSADA